MADRYELNHDGMIVEGERALCSDQTVIIRNLFSQYGWKCEIKSTSGPLREISITSPLGETRDLNVFSGTIRNEDRNPYEKKMQLNSADPRKYNKSNTIILGIYVYESDDDIKDAVFVGFPIDDRINYQTNPSLRGGIFINGLLAEAKTKGFVYDASHNNVGFRSEFIFYYLDNYYKLHYGKPDEKVISDLSVINSPNEDQEKSRVSYGNNVLLYGVPGSGKSYTIEHELCRGVKKDNRYRVVFHPEYMYSDFVGQILPKVIRSEEEDGKDEVSYRFVPGPFTNILNEAYHNPSDKYVLIIEELNRGNAPAIFGEIFQLLDRIGPNSQSNGEFPQGTSEYYINNESIAEYVFGFENKNHPVRIPSNLTILATMNTSDQNVFTLDTAFQRRWQMRQVENSFERVSIDLADQKILDTSVNWKRFCQEMNNQILINASEMSSTEDKRLGVYFVSKEDLSGNSLEYNVDEYIKLCKKDYDKLSSEEKSRFDQISEAINQNRRFPEKVLKYLWDDAFKFNTDRIFRKENKSLEDVISKFLKNKGDERWDIFNDAIKEKLLETGDRT